MNAVTTVMNLQLAGFSEKEIAELTILVGIWNKHWPGRVHVMVAAVRMDLKSTIN